MRGARFRRARFAHAVERQQAAARGAVMAGAEGERGLDFDADAVGGMPAAVVRAVHDKAAGRDRLESGEAFADPILRGDGVRSASALLAAAAPPATAASSRTLAASAGARKYTLTRQPPGWPASTRLTATSSRKTLGDRSAIRRADCSSVSSVATVVSLSSAAGGGRH